MISVLMATAQRPASLACVLESYVALASVSEGWEVVVVDNGNGDETRSIVDQKANVLPVKYVHEARRGKNYALRSGLAHVSGDLVLFTDDDILPPPQWLVGYSEAARQHPNYTILGGGITCRWPPQFAVPWLAEDTEIARACFASTNPRLGKGPIDPTELCGGNLAIRRTALDYQDLFDPRIGPSEGQYAMGSETSMILALRNRGHQAWFVEGICVEHIIRPEQLAQRWLLKRAERSGRGVYRLFIAPQSPSLVMGLPRSVLRQFAGHLVDSVIHGCKLDARGYFSSRWRAKRAYGQLREALRMANEL